MVAIMRAKPKRTDPAKSAIAKAVYDARIRRAAAQERINAAAAIAAQLRLAGLPEAAIIAIEYASVTAQANGLDL